MKVEETVANIKSASYIALICEGGAEAAIMDILLDNELLVFPRSKLINFGQTIRRTSAKEFQSRYLRVEYEGKL